jgi:OPA family sugar phosphate sensor protein UhpC-like MFS transporter
MIKKILNFYKMSSPSAPVLGDEKDQEKYYKKLRMSSFLAATIGYSLYYVCRTSLNVVKEPILASGALNATQLGVIGSTLLFAYAVGKLVNGFMADYSNIKRFMATGLIVSAIVNFMVAILGFAETGAFIGSATMVTIFAILWGMNGWMQSMGAPSAIISLSRWFPLGKRGTYYGFFSASHNLGEFLSFLFVGAIVSIFGWQFGFMGSSIAGVVGFGVIVFFLHDNPESKGLPPVQVLAKENTNSQEDKSVRKTQIEVLKNPGVWVLAMASACMYVSRYAINSWGVLFLQEEKGFSLSQATQIISINALLGIIGTVFSGWFSDKLFKGKRNFPALIFGVLNTIALILFIYGGNGLFMNVLSMILFGIAIGVLICFLGGLMAIDVVPRKASGAALGVVGIASYAAAGIQDVVSGWLIDSGKTVINDTVAYDFSTASMFWIVASAISFLLPLLIWKVKVKQKLRI